ncbi:MAG: Mov34/MPN/PAD-1 family protein [Fimbriiglobus sp.]
MTPPRLVLPPDVLAAVVAHARVELPNECCGFLSGMREPEPVVLRVSASHPIGNVLRSPTVFETEPRDVFAAFRAMRAAGTDVLAVYHSHPTSAPVPSRADLDRNTYGETVAWLIVGFPHSEPEVRAWWLTPSTFQEAAWEVVE